MSESQRKVDGTTAISTDYLRLITNTFERSLAAGQAPLIEWTEALQHEHQCVMQKIREDTVPSESISTNPPPYRSGSGMTESSYHTGNTVKQATNRSECVPHEELDHKRPCELDGPSAGYRSRLNISRSTRRVKPKQFTDEIIIFGDKSGNEAHLPTSPDTDIILVERTPKYTDSSGRPIVSHLDKTDPPESFILVPPGTNCHNSQTFGKVAHRCKNSGHRPFSTEIRIPGHTPQSTQLCSNIRGSPRTGKGGYSNYESMNLEAIAAQVKNLLHRYPEHLRLDDRGAQSILDDLQTLLDHPIPNVSEFRETVLSTLLRLSRRTNIYPSSFSLTHITLEGQQPVAHGSFGEIYRGHLHDRTVCLKVLRTYKPSDTSSLNKAFSREAIIWSQLSHVNVVPFYGVYNIDTRLALVSPWIENGNINHFLKANPDADRPLLISDVAEGLLYLHQSHIVHGDLKGGNILVTDSHRACLADFGLSTIAAHQGSLPSSGGPDGGTVRWQAPELMDPQLEAPKSQASDIYAFAFACYEIFTGNHPFPEVMHDFAVMLKVVRGERPSRPTKAFGLVDEMWSLMEDSWDHDPQHRPTASAIVKRLVPQVINRQRKSRKSVLEDKPLRLSISISKYNDRKEPSNARTFQALQHILKEITTRNPGTEAFLPNTFDEKKPTRLSNREESIHHESSTLDKDPTDLSSAEDTYIRLAETTTEEIDGEVDDDVRTKPFELVAVDEPILGSTGHDVELLHIVTRLSGIFGNLDQYKQILHCTRSKSQSQGLLDLFQKLLGIPDLGCQFRHNLMIATQRLAKSSDLYPNCFGLDDVASIEEHPVAAGSFADIHKGTINNKKVCLKVIRLYQASRVDYVLKRFYQEAILWGQLSHPNLLPFYGLYRFRNRLCLVSPWAENGDINNYLEQNPLVNRTQIALDIAAGILYLHTNDIIHGDLKGSNILVDDSGRARLADFGLSAVTDPKILKWTSQSSAASKGGSIRWQAPELFGAESDELVPNSKASDVYAWACVCYEIFTGDVPFFEFGRDSTVMLKVGLGKRPSRPVSTSQSWIAWGLTEAIWLLMESCWKDDPLERPSAEVLVAQLSSAIAKDTRPIGSWHDFTMSQLQEAVGARRYPSIDALEAMLWGTSTSNEIP